MAENIARLYEQGTWRKWIIPIISIVTLLTCIQQINVHNYNNINIFRYSSLHLLAHQPLYIEYPQSYFDYYLYHPAFTVLFMPFAYLSAPAALCVWICLSMAVFFRTIQLLPGITDASKKIILLLALPELINNQQYVQTNIFLTSLMLLAFIYFERGMLFWAAFFSVLAFCIKGYGGITGLLFLLYPGRLKFLGYSFFWVLLITALPLLFVSFHETITYYTDWLKMISSDEIKEGMSVVGKWGKTHTSELFITITALILLVSTFVQPLRHAAIRNNFYFRGLLCCYLLVWVVLFNRAAESPTYLLATTGLAFWFILDGFKKENMYMTSLVLFVSYLFLSDIFPGFIHRFFRVHHMKPYAFMLFFLYLQFQLFYKPYHARVNTATYQ
ncbi:MAG: glycosyltransferase family 87 protein [Bacteroidota bacterium]